MSAAVRALEKERDRLTARLQKLAARTDELEAEMAAVETERETLAGQSNKLAEAIETVKGLGLSRPRSQAQRSGQVPANGSLRQRVLAELVAAPKGLAPSVLAKALGNSPGGVSASLNDLRREGLVENPARGLWRAIPKVTAA